MTTDELKIWADTLTEADLEGMHPIYPALELRAAVLALIAERDALRKLLKRIEFGGTTGFGQPACPMCGGATHWPNCNLRVALIEEEP